MRPLVFALLLSLASAQQVASAPDATAQPHCLSAAEQRSAVQSGEVVRPGSIRVRGDEEVLRLALCRDIDGLAWHVTVLQGDGQVVDRVVDARSGRPVR